MTQLEKIEMLQDSIKQLRVNECKSVNYISQLLKLDRKVLTSKIKEWGYEPRNDKRGIKPSTQKFINKHKQFIISAYNNDVSLVDVIKQLGTKESLMRSVNVYDDEIKIAFEAMKKRKALKVEQNRQLDKDNSFHDYNFVSFDDEVWKEIMGYPNYSVSNYGRVKRYMPTYNDDYLLKPCQNVLNGRLYVSLSNGEKKQNLQVARLVGFAFCDGHSEFNNTINHKDGDEENNKSTNLEWVSQSQNNKHAYDVLHRVVNVGKPIDYVIVYENKYTFKTVAAFARFLNKSETQTRRYLKEPEKHNIKLIAK